MKKNGRRRISTVSSFRIYNNSLPVRWAWTWTETDPWVNHVYSSYCVRLQQSVHGRATNSDFCKKARSAGIVIRRKQDGGRSPDERSPTVLCNRFGANVPGACSVARMSMSSEWMARNLGLKTPRADWGSFVRQGRLCGRRPIPLWSARLAIWKQQRSHARESPNEIVAFVYYAYSTTNPLGFFGKRFSKWIPTFRVFVLRHVADVFVLNAGG